MRRAVRRVASADGSTRAVVGSVAPAAVGQHEVMSRRTHVVLGGGAAMGAFQVGALLALLEAGLRVDLVHGSSVGALNAVFLAVRPDLARGRELAAWWAEPSMARCSGLVGPPGSAASRTRYDPAAPCWTRVHCGG
jgi:predicted acylesterase/phospholipase RssA